MRLSQFFLPTLHQAPGEAAEASHRLLLRAGLTRALGAGSFAYLPLGEQVRRRVRAGARRVMAALGGHELSLPPLVPDAAWEEAGLRPSGVPVRVLSDRELRLPPTLEPLLTALLRPDLRSHRALPLLLYGFRPCFQEQTPSAPGPLSARQSLVLEAFALHGGAESLQEGFRRLQSGCRLLLQHCGLRDGLVEIGYQDEEQNAELILPGVPGEEPFVRCPGCGYVAALHRAQRGKEPSPPEEPQPLEEVFTPGCHTIAELAAFLGLPESRTAKAVFLVGEGDLVFAVVRGDMEVDELKLARLVRAERLRPARDDEIVALGASPGFASPIGIRRSAPEAGLERVLVVVDDLIVRSPSLVAGANKPDTHLRNVTYGRDYAADLVGDIAAVHPGDPCPACGAALEPFSTTTLARLWAPGARYSAALGATFQDAAGRERPLHLACIQVDLDRLLAACVEVHHDEAGIRWPVRVAPYPVHLLAIGNAPEVLQSAAGLEQSLQAEGVDVLFDDRDMSAGSKLVEADLLGMPLRIAVSKRTVAQSAAEVKRRDEPRDAVQVLSLTDVPAWVHSSLRSLGGEDG